MAGTPVSEARMVGSWELQKHIGSGSFAVVWKARHCHTGEVMAIKEIAMDKLNGKLKQSLESEVSILRQITHQNVVKLHDVIEVRLQLLSQPELGIPMITLCSRLATRLPGTTGSANLDSPRTKHYPTSYSAQGLAAGSQQALPCHGVLWRWRPLSLYPQAQARDRGHSQRADAPAGCWPRGAQVPSVCARAPQTLTATRLSDIAACSLVHSDCSVRAGLGT